ncbi:hypothetical protein BJ944DRAFT_228968 [Cunninghamella echinulata]|nr:hypothetical protein BJ944DRAFT_228968 [Cunninghamella echinulata]
MLGSEHTDWLSNEDKTTSYETAFTNTSPPKKKSMERISRLFQKKNKQKKTLSTTLENLDLEAYEPVSRRTSIRSHNSTSQHELSPKSIKSTHSTGKKGGESLKRLTSLKPNNKTFNNTTRPLSITDLQYELQQKQQLLEHLSFERDRCQKENEHLQSELKRMNQKIHDRTIASEQIKEQYEQHLKSLRATPDDIHTVKERLIQFQQQISDLTERLMPHISEEHTYKALSTFWLNLRQVIEPMIPLSMSLTRFLTEKFIMDVLVQNFNLGDIAGCSCSEAYADLALWFLDNDVNDNISFNNSNNNNQDISDATMYSIRLRQQVALTVVSSQQKESPCQDIKKQLHQVVQGHWKYLYGGLAKAFPYIYHHDTTLEKDVKKHFGAQIQILVEQAVAIGFAIKGLELDITAADVQEGYQLLDTSLMDELQGKTSGTIHFCICPPFKIFNQNDPLLKGKVVCL